MVSTFIFQPSGYIRGYQPTCIDAITIKTYAGFVLVIVDSHLRSPCTVHVYRESFMKENFHNMLIVHVPVFMKNVCDSVSDLVMIQLCIKKK